MKELLQQSLFFLNVKEVFDNKNDALDYIASQIVSVIGGNHRKLRKAFLAREELSTTGFGNGFAIPHAKLKKLEQPAIAVFHFQQKVPWEALDDQPVEMAIALVMPEKDDGNMHLQILASLSRKLMNEDFTQKLLAISNPETLYTFLEKELEE